MLENTNFFDQLFVFSAIKEIKEDPKDDMILECALEGKAKHIVTGDKHLLKLKEFRAIKILTPKENAIGYKLHNGCLRL